MLNRNSSDTHTKTADIRFLKRLRLITIVGFILILLVALGGMVAVVAYAAGPPDNPGTVDVKSKYVYQDLLETDDMLVIFYFDISYNGTYPYGDAVESMADYFTFRLIDTDNVTELGANLVYPYPFLGWGQGVSCFYFDNATAPAWNGLYSVRLSGNPSKYPDPQNWNFSLVASDYSALDGQANNQGLLTTQILLYALNLETYYQLYADIDLLAEGDTGTVLGPAGEQYFRNAIQGIQGMAPDLFEVQVLTADYSARSWGSTLETYLQTRYAGTWVETGFAGFSGFLGIADREVGSGLIFLFFAVFMIGFNVWFAGKGPRFAVTKNPVNAGIMDALVVVLAGALLGAVSFQFEALLTFFCAFLTGFILFLNRA